MFSGKMIKGKATEMTWMVLMRGARVCVWARINYGRSNQVIMQSRQQPSGKKLITAPDSRGSRGSGLVGEEKEAGWRYFGTLCLLIYNTKYMKIQ